MPAYLEGLDVLPLATVHDELLLESREEDAEAVSKALQQAMVAGFLQVFPGSEALTRGLAEAGTGQSWKDAK